MSSDAKSTQPAKSRASALSVRHKPVRIKQAPTRFVRLSDLRDLGKCEQVAAVCYRVRDEEIEFLLVRTRGSRRWTFPKGGAEPGLTHAQAAALEAFEEGGVHGRIEQASFTRYVSGKSRAVGKDERVAEDKGLTIHAHLCEVLRLTKPKEQNRDRTWFSAIEAGQRLREGRKSRHGKEFARVIDSAVKRIGRLLRTADTPSNQTQNYGSKLDQPQDALQKVQFEAIFDPRGWARRTPYVPNTIRRFDATQKSVAFAVTQPTKLLQADVLQFSTNNTGSISLRKSRSSATNARNG